MNITEFQVKFNDYAVKNKQKFSIVKVQTAKELHGEKYKEEYKHGAFVISDKLSGIVFNEEDIMGLELFSALGDGEAASMTYLVVAVLIDIFCEYDNYNRNKVIQKLGFNGKNFGKGKEYEDNKFKFGCILLGKFSKISIAKRG